MQYLLECLGSLVADASGGASGDENNLFGAGHGDRGKVGKYERME